MSRQISSGGAEIAGHKLVFAGGLAMLVGQN